jgi:hypothetical protein
MPRDLLSPLSQSHTQTTREKSIRAEGCKDYEEQVARRRRSLSASHLLLRRRGRDLAGDGADLDAGAVARIPVAQGRPPRWRRRSRRARAREELGAGAAARVPAARGRP